MRFRAMGRTGRGARLFVPVFLLLIAAGAAIGRGIVSAQTSTEGVVFLSLTEEERAWLQAHPVIRVVQDPGWPPIEFADEQGEPAGIADDYLRLVEHRLGVTFERVRGLTWQEAYDLLRSRDIDMTTSVAITPQREAFWAFTQPYMRVPIVIATRADVTYVGDLRELSGKKVAVVDGYVSGEWIPRDFPEIQLVKVGNVKEGLDRLKKGEVFAFVDNMLVIGYYIARMKLYGLKIAGETSYENAQAMAVRKDWAILAGILQKALDSVPASEHQEIYRKWVPVRYEHGFNYSFFWKILAVFFAVLGGMFFWIRKLSQEIARRKKAEASFREAEVRYRQLFEHSPDANVILDPDTARLLEFNEATCRQLGYSREELSRLTLFDIDASETTEETRERIATVLREGRVDFETLQRTRTGEIRNVYVTAQHIQIVGRSVYHCVWRDITLLKRAQKALIQNEALLQIAGRIARVGGWSMDLPEYRIARSDEMSVIFEMPSGYIPSMEDIFGFFPSEWKERFREVFTACAQEGTPFDEEMEVMTGKKRRIWVRCIGEAVRDASGKIAKLQGAFQEITERKRVEEENKKCMREIEVFFKAGMSREELILGLKKEIDRLKKLAGQ